MATIPIEVIVQDAEAPIVPSEDGTNNTETNIAVPGTGTIGSSGDTSSSVSSIILPAILLVLAIGSIVAILIHKYHKQKKDKTSRKEKLAVAASSTIVVLAATILISNLVLPATKAATSDITDVIIPSEDKISITVTRDGGSAEVSTESIAYITSHADFGYKVLLAMAEGVDTANLYLNGDTTSGHYIASTESTELANNTWGYTLEEGSNYTAVPLLDSAATVAQGNNVVEAEELGIYYGVKVSSDLPAGTYSGGGIEYTLEAKEPTLPITYMQDFATLSEEDKTALIESMPEGYQFTLKDNRDQKDYFISKLADGNVWMTQNLDLDLSTEVALTPATTNITENWTPMRSTIDFTGTSVSEWSNAETTPDSASPGDVYYYTSGTMENDTQYNSLAECMAANHTEAECRHYHAGNYYNWPAAVASNDAGVVEPYRDAAGSICPAGWRLPKQIGAGGDMDRNEMIEMISAYGNILGTWGGNYYPFLEGGFNAVRISPIWISRAGAVNWGSVTGGVGAFYWSSTKGSDRSLAYRSVVQYERIYLSYNGTRYGKSIRCLVE